MQQCAAMPLNYQARRAAAEDIHQHLSTLLAFSGSAVPAAVANPSTSGPWPSVPATQPIETIIKYAPRDPNQRAAVAAVAEHVTAADGSVQATTWQEDAARLVRS